MKDAQSVQQKKLEATKNKIIEKQAQKKKLQTQWQKWAIGRKKKLLKEQHKKDDLDRL